MLSDPASLARRAAGEIRRKRWKDARSSIRDLLRVAQPSDADPDCRREVAALQHAAKPILSDLEKGANQKQADRWAADLEDLAKAVDEACG